MCNDDYSCIKYARYVLILRGRYRENIENFEKCLLQNRESDKCNRGHRIFTQNKYYNIITYTITEVLFFFNIFYSQ